MQQFHYRLSRVKNYNIYLYYIYYVNEKEFQYPCHLKQINIA